MGTPRATRAPTESRSRPEPPAIDRALRFLAQRPRSEREIRRRLAQHEVPDDAIEATIARLRELGLADDKAFASYWVENRAQFKPRGARALKAELFAKGVARPTIEESVGDDNVDDAYRAAERRAKQLGNLDDQTFRQRMSQFLARRGFGWDTIEPTLQRLRPGCAPASRSRGQP